MREAWRVLYSAGINFINTTQAYGDGKSEEIVGDLITSVPRDTVVVQTKYYPMPIDKDNLLHPSIAPVKKLRQSLKHMKLKYVDVNLVHGPVHPGGIAQAAKGMADCVKEVWHLQSVSLTIAQPTCCGLRRS